MSERNTRLQDKGLFAHKMYSQVKAFMAIVKLLSRQVETNTLTHFPILKDSTLSDDQYSRYASLLHGEISRQSEDFKAVESEMLLVSSPFRCDVDKVISRWNSSTCSQMHFYQNNQSSATAEILLLCQGRDLAQMGRQAHEQTFSVMKFNMLRYRSSHR